MAVPFSQNIQFCENMEAAEGKGAVLSDAGICRTIHQYSDGPIRGEDMDRLLEIAEDYRRVKNYVYARYGGIGSLEKLYPGYTVQNEMTQSGFRAELAMPSVYFYRAVFDALGDIRGQWGRTRAKIAGLVGRNERLSAEEKHYLRFLLRSTNAMDAILNQKSLQLPSGMQAGYEKLAAKVDTEKMSRYLCRQVRKYHVRTLSADKAEGFHITERAYRYGPEKDGDGRYGIYVAAKEGRKRIFIPLTDTNAYTKQLYIRLNAEEKTVDIAVPIALKVKRHRDYQGELGLSPGIDCMFTTHEGHCYGEKFGELHRELAAYMSRADRTYRREKANNAGRKKYRSRKKKLDAGLETYVNQELNRMIATEKPRTIYIPRLPARSAAGHDGGINYSVHVWKRGMIGERLRQKCLEHSIEIVEVIGRGISTECSRCGAAGKYTGNSFRCGVCGYEADKKTNAAQNALKRGRTGRRVNKTFVPEGKNGQDQSDSS